MLAPTISPHNSRIVVERHRLEQELSAKRL
jgi:hypothetical protein